MSVEILASTNSLIFGPVNWRGSSLSYGLILVLQINDATFVRFYQTSADRLELCVCMRVCHSSRAGKLCQVIFQD